MKKGIGLFLMVVILGGGLFAWYHIPKRKLPTVQWSETTSPQGVFHVHSDASHDSQLSVDTIADTAVEMKLNFVVLTNHNSQKSSFQKKAVTFLSYAELSTKFGHVIQFGADTLLSREEKNRVDLGPLLEAQNARAIIAHPTDFKRPWNGRWRDVGGIEIASVSAASRRLAGPVLLGALPAVAAWKLNEPLALAQLYDRDHKALSRWDENPNPQQIGICGVDAHGRVDLRANLSLWRIRLEVGLPQDPNKKASAIIAAINEGRFHCIASLFGEKPEFYFEAHKGSVTVGSAGDSIPADELSELVVRAPIIHFPKQGQTLTMILLRNGEEVLRQQGRELKYAHPKPGTYRVEIRIPVPNLLFGYRSVPIIYSNKIRVLSK